MSLNGPLLDRDISIAQTSAIRDLARPVLMRVVDESVGILTRSISTADHQYEHRGILMPFHHAIEMLDGVEVLLNNSCIVASHTPLRSAFEASLAVRYVLAKDTETRSLSYVVGDFYRRLHWYEDHDPESDRGRQFAWEMELEDGEGFPMPTREEVVASIESIEHDLASDPYSPIAAEYKRTVKKLHRRRVNWYSLFDGPMSLKELAKSLGEIRDYNTLYRKLSGTAHVTDLGRQLSRERENAAPAITVIRAPMEISLTYGLGINLGYEVVWTVMKHYRPDEADRFARWHMREVGPVVQQLLGH